MATTALKPTQPGSQNNAFKDKEKPQAVRTANIVAAKAVADAIRTSLGPRGMDKMIQTGKGETIITNDGNTMLKDMSVMHPAAKMLVDLANAQDIEAGDGTTSVVVIAGSLLGAAEKLLAKGLHPTIISESFQRAAAKAVEILQDMATPINLSDRPTLLKAAATSLSSKIVSQEPKLAPMAVDSVLKTIDPRTADNVDLKNIRILKKVGGTIDDSEMIDGLVLNQQVVKSGGGLTRVEKARIGLIQFQLSPPKPDLENQIVVNDYRQMDKILKEERTYLLNMVKKIKKAKCNVLFIQKSILRDAVNDLSLHFLAKLNILAVKDIERDEVEFICKSTGCKPIADIESFTEDKLGAADLIEEDNTMGARLVKVTGVRTSLPSQAPPSTSQPAAQSSTSSGASTGRSTTPDNKSSIPSATNAPTSSTDKPTSATSATTPVPPPSRTRTVSLVVRGANQLVLDEAERSLHDAHCAIRSLVKKPALLSGGGAPEIEISTSLTKASRTLAGPEGICWRAFAEALEVIPTTLAENAGLNPISVVTDLRYRHAEGGEKNAGVSVRTGGVKSDIRDENVAMPLLVCTSAVELAGECVKGILRIDDIALAR
ncbi:MAG: T-complex protein 1 subunit delta [Alyxoria varia]|nr:MAG: T-complex protein 1 subunit delta [Alyxoria varia]